MLPISWGSNPHVTRNQIVSGEWRAGFGCKYWMTEGLAIDAQD